MTGPEHFARAAHYLAQAEDEMALAAGQGTAHVDAGVPLVRVALAMAQVHATLALTAATFEAMRDPERRPVEIMRAWREVTS